MYGKGGETLQAWLKGRREMAGTHEWREAGRSACLAALQGFIELLITYSSPLYVCNCRIEQRPDIQGSCPGGQRVGESETSVFCVYAASLVYKDRLTVLLLPAECAVK